jgi:hypothetical protein
MRSTRTPLSHVWRKTGSGVTGEVFAPALQRGSAPAASVSLAEVNPATTQCPPITTTD